ncbi:MAG: ribulose-phosphate 3-epimerase [Patescibacteria group bacterium]|nr:ribulose-phosphate 3-epimerase [Patescibacteria group bacterium]
MSSPKISASLMCADLGNLETEVQKLTKAGVDYLHIDIMDGHFVPNFTFGPDLVKKIRGFSNLPLDIHLMIEHPEQYLDLWELKKGDILSFHIEANLHPQRVLAQIKTLGAKAAIALNPATPLSVIQYLLPELDLVLLMAVNPGFAGQKWIPAVLDKVRELKTIIQKQNLKTEIEVDGNIGKHNLGSLKRAGANIFVGGSSSVFASPAYAKNTRKMRKAR